MHFERFYDDVLAHASYLLGDEHSGLAAVVDPKRDVDVYLDAARARGLRIRYAILTRAHTGFVTGHIELRDRVGAEVVVSTTSKATFTARRVADGDELSLGGDVRLTFLETPGATDDGLSCVVQDRSRGPQPWGVFTGDALPVDAVPRSDLGALNGADLEAQACLLHATLQRKLLALPDATRVYPARGFSPHAARVPLPPAASTLGQQRATNPVLRLPLRSFAPISVQAAHATPAPAYAEHALGMNLEERPSLETVLEDVVPLELDTVLNAVARGSLLIDARPSLEYLLGHARGSLAVPLDAHFGPWVATLVPPKKPMLMVAPEGRALESAIALARIGFDTVWGYLRDGISAFRSLRPDLLARTPALSPVELALRRDAQVVDVRTLAERELRRIPATVHVPLQELARRAPREVARDKLVVLTSERGDRSATAASILERLGYSRLGSLLGGMSAWEESGQSVEGLLAPERRISA
ncbi:MAG TPA: MBL fold metallo-hydrolase [Planctomycetota bacterium]|nr:MBL fold metallo-hydrolase [Planctomycetota bacterium]